MARRGKTGRFFVRLLILIVLVAVVFGAVAAFRVGPAPEVEISSDLPGIGKSTRITVQLREPKRGLSRVEVDLLQGDRVERLAEREYEPLEPWEFWGARTQQDTLSLEVGSATLKGLREGTATIRVQASPAPGKLRAGDPAVEQLELPVKLKPPTLQVVSTRTYVAQGGSEAVVYKVGAGAVEDGVRVGEWWFPGYPLPGGGDDDRFALFGVPFDFDATDSIRLIARDDVGNESRAGFVDRFIEKPFKPDTIRISDSFMEKVVQPILDQTPGLEDRGSLLDNYLMINGELRARNAATLTELAERSTPEFLWRGRFLQMRNAQVMSRFADRRTYVYDGQPVDKQDHLGIDLASTRLAPIQASNSGNVVLAGYFGIYGNTVVIDHGYGLLSLYGHLSSIDVEEGQSVERGQQIGRSGATGLAAGDHLHFTMLLRGLSVNPQEWWDGHWIQDRLRLKLGDALPPAP